MSLDLRPGDQELAWERHHAPLPGHAHALPEQRERVAFSVSSFFETKVSNVMIFDFGALRSEHDKAMVSQLRQFSHDRDFEVA